MSEKWRLGILGLGLILLGVGGIVLILRPDVDWRVVLEIMGVLFFLTITLLGARLATIALEE